MENLHDDYALQILVSRGLVPAIKEAISEHEDGDKTVDEFAADVRLLLNGYDKFLRTGRTS